MINFAVSKNNFKLIYDFRKVGAISLGYLSEYNERIDCSGAHELFAHYFTLKL